ncbi:hypothetical protein [Cohnella soli]|uniref:Uncharacterized protein n=1 Tax=Cohnella soli TaxID=425005 RepID=A0ABW0HQT9_9BACL
MRTKAYSTRLRYEDELDEAIIQILDEIENNDEDPGEWLREAARMRLELASRPVAEQPADNLAVFTLFTDQEATGLEHVVQRLFEAMSDEQKTAYIQEAIRMRVAIETDAPAYFINRWNQQQGSQEASLPADGHERLSTVSEVPLIALEKDGGQPPPETQEDGLSLYRNALAALMRLEMMERA